MKSKKEILKGILIGLTFLLALSPSFAANGIISNSGISAVEQAVGGTIMLSFIFFILVAFVQGAFHIPWIISMMLYFITFALLTALDFFSYNIVVIITVLMFTVIGYGFSRIFADLIFA